MNTGKIELLNGLFLLLADVTGQPDPEAPFADAIRQFPVRYPEELAQWLGYVR